MHNRFIVVTLHNTLYVIDVDNPDTPIAYSDSKGETGLRELVAAANREVDFTVSHAVLDTDGDVVHLDWTDTTATWVPIPQPTGKMTAPSRHLPAPGTRSRQVLNAIRTLGQATLQDLVLKCDISRVGAGGCLNNLMTRELIVGEKQEAHGRPGRPPYKYTLTAHAAQLYSETAGKPSKTNQELVFDGYRQFGPICASGLAEKMGRTSKWISGPTTILLQRGRIKIVGSEPFGMLGSTRSIYAVA